MGDWSGSRYLLEVVIEEAIEDRVGAGRGDPDEVADHEAEHHAVGALEHVADLCDQAEEAEGKPADEESEGDEEEDEVGPPLSGTHAWL